MKWFVNTVNIGAYKIQEIKAKHERLKDELELTDHKNVVKTRTHKPVHRNIEGQG